MVQLVLINWQLFVLFFNRFKIKNLIQHNDQSRKQFKNQNVGEENFCGLKVEQISNIIIDSERSEDISVIQ